MRSDFSLNNNTQNASGIESLRDEKAGLPGYYYVQFNEKTQFNKYSTRTNKQCYNTRQLRSCILFVGMRLRLLSRYFSPHLATTNNNLYHDSQRATG